MKQETSLALSQVPLAWMMHASNGFPMDVFLINADHQSAQRACVVFHLDEGFGADVADGCAVSAVDADQEKRLDAPQAGVPDGLTGAAESLGNMKACSRCRQDD